MSPGGSEDSQIHYFKQDLPCKAGSERLKSVQEEIQQNQTCDPFQDITDSDVEDVGPKGCFLIIMMTFQMKN